MFVGLGRILERRGGFTSEPAAIAARDAAVGLRPQTNPARGAGRFHSDRCAVGVTQRAERGACSRLHPVQPGVRREEGKAGPGDGGGVDAGTHRVFTLTRLPMAKIAEDSPNGEPHLACLSGGDKVGVIEVVEYPPHDYEASSVVYEDATRPLCAYCEGTHGPLDTLILPPGVARNLGSTNFR